eukprot:TRINITY_DN28294_c0_g1_i2.p1 TRINITY_DN28294_c0_g1~~TRINITY_DN28294_c0_g1_i2.p1  ORF type:complete len:459 (+),score=89.76 TRINITY_DN28294_c0_g1_i2:99-1379(+)
MMLAASITVTAARICRINNGVVRSSVLSSIVSHCIADVMFPAALVLLYRAVPLPRIAAKYPAPVETPYKNILPAASSLLHPGPQAQHPSATEIRAPQDLGRSVGLLVPGPSVPLQPLAVQQCTWNPHDALLLYVLCASMGGTLLLSTMVGYDGQTALFFETNSVMSAVASSCALGFLVLLGGTVRAASVSKVKGFSGTPCGVITAVLIPGTFTAVLVWLVGVAWQLSKPSVLELTATDLIGAGAICVATLSAVALMVLGQALIRGKQAHIAATLLFLFAVLLFESLSITGSAAALLKDNTDSVMRPSLSTQIAGGAVAMCAVTLMMVLPPIRTHASVLFVVGVVVAEAGRIAQTKKAGGLFSFTDVSVTQGYIHVINALAVVVVALSRRDEQGCHSSNHSDGAPLLPAQPAGYGTGTAVPHPARHG